MLFPRKCSLDVFYSNRFTPVGWLRRLLAGSAKHSVRSRILVNDCQFHMFLKRLRRQP